MLMARFWALHNSSLRVCKLDVWHSEGVLEQRLYCWASENSSLAHGVTGRRGSFGACIDFIDRFNGYFIATS